MDISNLLCLPLEANDEAQPSPPVRTICTRDQVERPTLTPVPTSRFSPLGAPAAPNKPPAPSKKRRSNASTTLSMVPDKERKRAYRMSASQRERRRNYEAHESRVYNLTLDINDLRQQVRYLTERRDLHVMRLLLTRQHFERDVLSVVDRILCGFRDEALGLTPSERGFFFSGILPGDVATGGGHGFVLQRGRPLFSHRACAITSIRVLSFVGDDVEADDEEAAELRRLCGGSGGCVVEALGNFTGRITRATITALFPHILCNETLVARLLGLRIACPARLLLYFDDQRRIVQQTVRADMVTALNSLREARPNDFAALMGPSR